MRQVSKDVYIGTPKDAQNGNLIKTTGIQSIFFISTVFDAPVHGGVMTRQLKIQDGEWWDSQVRWEAGHFIDVALKRGKLLVCSDLGGSRCYAALLVYQADYKDTPDLELAGAQVHPDILSDNTRQDMEIVRSKARTLPDWETPSLSVVIVTWNRLALVRQCIEAIKENTPEGYELIIVDNGSTDGTVEYLEGVEPDTLIKMRKNFGKGVAANKGFAEARGEWIAYLDSDIVVPHGWFNYIRKAHEEVPTAAWLTLPYKDQKLTNVQAFGKSRIALADTVDGGLVFMKREVLEYLGGFIEDRLYGGIDTAYMQRARDRHLTVGYVETAPEGVRRCLVHLGKERDSAEYRELKDAEKVQVPKEPALPAPNSYVIPQISPYKVEVLIVRFNQPELENACIQSVKECTGWQYELTIIDNYRKKERLGVLWNHMIEASKQKYVCLLNSDCLVTPGWLARMMLTFGKDSSILVVGPSTNECATKQRIAVTPGVSQGEQLSNNMFAHMRAKNPDYQGKYEETEISGFCYLLDKAAFTQVGKFNEQVGLYGQETEFNIRLKDAGFKTVWCQDAFVYHEGAGSVVEGEIDVEADKALAAKILEKKGQE